MYSGEHAEPQGSGILRTIVGLLVMVALVFGLSWALRTFVFQAYEIPSGSMEETIMTGDMVFSEKVSYYLRDVQPGDIVTFQDPEIPGRVLIKRVIAVGGQTVDLVDGKVPSTQLPAMGAWKRVFEVEQWDDEAGELRIPKTEHGMTPTEKYTMSVVRQRVDRTALDYYGDAAAQGRTGIINAM